MKHKASCLPSLAAAQKTVAGWELTETQSRRADGCCSSPCCSRCTLGDYLYTVLFILPSQLHSSCYSFVKHASYSNPIFVQLSQIHLLQMLFFFFFGAEDWTQGLGLVRQALCYWAKSPTLCYFFKQAFSVPIWFVDGILQLQKSCNAFYRAYMYVF